MVKVKGKYITFCGKLMTLYKESQKKADGILFEKTGLHFDELEPEEWYDGDIITLFMETYKNSSPTGREAMLTMGRNIFPIIKQTVGLPDFKSPLEALKYESKTYLMDHKSDEKSEVIPRKFLKFEERHVIIQAPGPGFDIMLFKGVYIGIFRMLGIKNVKVEIIDEENAIFEIKW